VNRLAQLAVSHAILIQVQLNSGDSAIGVANAMAHRVTFAACGGAGLKGAEYRDAKV
jgi:hypothetical protein